MDFAASRLLGAAMTVYKPSGRNPSSSESRGARISLFAPPTGAHVIMPNGLLSFTVDLKILSALSSVV